MSIGDAEHESGFVHPASCLRFSSKTPKNYFFRLLALYSSLSSWNFFIFRPARRCLCAPSVSLSERRHNVLNGDVSADRRNRNLAFPSQALVVVAPTETFGCIPGTAGAGNLR